MAQAKVLPLNQAHEAILLAASNVLEALETPSQVDYDVRWPEGRVVKVAIELHVVADGLWVAVEQLELTLVGG